MSEETEGAKKIPAATKKNTTRRTTKSASSTTAKKPAAKKAAAPRKTGATKAASAKTAATKAKSSKTSQSTGAKPSGAKATATKKTATPKVASEAKTSQQEDTTGANTMNSENTTHSENNNSSQMLEDLKGRDWPKILTRALLMFFFGVLGSAALWVAFFLAATQVVFTIFAGETNPSLTRIIKQLANFIHDVLDYLSFASDETPFPFERKWPDAS